MLNSQEYESHQIFFWDLYLSIKKESGKKEVRFWAFTGTFWADSEQKDLN
jgi:hypothetical protein